MSCRVNSDSFCLVQEIKTFYSSSSYLILHNLHLVQSLPMLQVYSSDPTFKFTKYAFSFAQFTRYSFVHLLPFKSSTEENIRSLSWLIKTKLLVTTDSHPSLLTRKMFAFILAKSLRTHKRSVNLLQNLFAFPLGCDVGFLGVKHFRHPRPTHITFMLLSPHSCVSELLLAIITETTEGLQARYYLLAVISVIGHITVAYVWVLGRYLALYLCRCFVCLFACLLACLFSCLFVCLVGWGTGHQ